MPARAYTIPITTNLASAYNSETFPFLETRPMKGGVFSAISRFIRGSAFTKAVAISVASSWLEVSTKAPDSRGCERRSFSDPVADAIVFG
jgi:hypothetical protein